MVRQTSSSAARRFDFDPNWGHRALYNKFTHTGDGWPDVASKVQQKVFKSLLKLILETPMAVEHAYPLWETIMPEIAAYADTLIDEDLAKALKSKKPSSLERHATLTEVKHAISLYHDLSTPSKYDDPQNMVDAVTMIGDKDHVSLKRLRDPSRMRSAPVAKHSMMLDYVAYAQDYEAARGLGATAALHPDGFGPSVRCPPLCRCVDCVGKQMAELHGMVSPNRRPENTGMSLDEVRCTVGLRWMKPHSAPAETKKLDPLESYLAVPDILTNVLSFKYCFGYGQDVMTNDFTIGLLKWVCNALDMYCKSYPTSSWIDFWKECYETVIMFLMPMEANNRIAQQLSLARYHLDGYPIELFKNFFFPKILANAGMDGREWGRIREIYLPDIGGFHFRCWEPQKECLWVPRGRYDIFKYNRFALTGVTPVELWSEWCCGLWGQTSISEHELTRYQLSKPGTFSFKCPYRRKIIEIIAFGVLKKGVHPQLIVDYLQAVMLINMQPDLVFLARMWSPIAENLYQRDFLENRYGLTDEEILSVRDFGRSVVKEEVKLNVTLTV